MAVTSLSAMIPLDRFTYYWSGRNLTVAALEQRGRRRAWEWRRAENGELDRAAHGVVSVATSDLRAYDLSPGQR